MCCKETNCTDAVNISLNSQELEFSIWRTYMMNASSCLFVIWCDVGISLFGCSRSHGLNERKILK